MHISLSPGRFVHDIDPVLIAIGSLRLYYYGLAYTLGFVGLHLWLSRLGPERGWTKRQVYDFSIIVSLSVLLFGRAFEIAVYEWEYFRAHVGQLLSYWRGGMASHGVLLGSVVGIGLFSRLQRRRFLQVADEVVIPAALFLAIGRIGNFINGEIVGTVTDLPWAVKFPDVDGFRHPVALYESLKNLALIPILLTVGRRARIGDGKLTAHFILWYGLLRLVADGFREYGTSYMGIGTGQYFNLLMALAGVGLLIGFTRFPRNPAPSKHDAQRGSGLFLRRAVLAAILVFYLLIPSSWSRGSLEFYRERSGAQSSAPANLSCTALPNR